MSNRKGSRSMEKAWKTLVIANLCLWIYFWAAFAHASYPFLPDRLGHPAGTAYAFWGYSIAVVESGLVYPFFKVVFYAEFSAFALATLTAQGLSPHLLLNGFFGGISGGGWLLLGVMVLSFFEWYLVGWAAQKLWQKWPGHPTGIRNHTPSSGPTPRTPLPSVLERV